MDKSLWNACGDIRDMEGELVYILLYANNAVLLAIISGEKIE